MGLSKLRYKATDNDIQMAFRKKVLKHHPDKKAAKHGGQANDDKFFKCVQKAFEILTDPAKRRQWDSVDPGVPDLAPKEGAVVQADKFFEIYGKVFELEGRFWKSPYMVAMENGFGKGGGRKKKTPLPDPDEKPPTLGDWDTPKDEVMAFYDFWYNFESWRSFEYEDKDDVEMADK